jgi:hypothetical protein
VINNFTVAEDYANLWTLSGTVTDSNYSVAGMTVSFGGVFVAYGLSVVVGADGSFSSTQIIAGVQGGTATAQTTDPGGEMSNLAETNVVV